MDDQPKRKRRRWVIISLIVSVLICVGGIAWWWQRCPSDPGLFVELECRHESGNLTGDVSWTLKVDSLGNGTVETWAGISRRSFSAPSLVQEFQRAITEYRPCELPNKIGDPVADSPWDVMRIKTTTFEKTIEMGYVQPDDRFNRDMLCAERLWQLADGFVKGPQSVPSK